MSEVTEMLHQQSPYPLELEEMVHRLRVFPDWSFELRDIDRGQGCNGLTLAIYIDPTDAYHQNQRRGVVHYFPVPAAAFDRQSWQRWLREQCAAVQGHELNEFFDVDGDRPYSPNHGPGRDPYVTFEYATDEQRRTSFRGHVKDDRHDEEVPLASTHGN